MTVKEKAKSCADKARYFMGLKVSDFPSDKYRDQTDDIHGGFMDLLKDNDAVAAGTTLARSPTLLDCIAEAGSDEDVNIRVCADRAFEGALCLLVCLSDDELRNPVIELADVLTSHKIAAKKLAARALNLLSGNGHDIAPAVDALEQASGHVKIEIRGLSSQALTYQYIRTGENEKTKGLLIKPELTSDVAHILASATLKGNKSTIPLLLHGCYNDNPGVALISSIWISKTIADSDNTMKDEIMGSINDIVGSNLVPLILIREVNRALILRRAVKAGCNRV